MMAGIPEAEHWEDLEKLTLNDRPVAAQTTAAPSRPEPDNNTQARPPSDNNGRDVAIPPVDSVDAAIRQALYDSKERYTVFRIEDLVVNYIKDTTQEVLEFPSSYSNYQRLLAHRVAQHYGLQTHTVDYEEGNGRVVARRTADSRLHEVKLADLVPRGSAERIVPPKIMKRPVVDEQGRVQTDGSDTTSMQSPVVSVKEREEDYNEARERIIGKPAEPIGDRNQNRFGRGSGGPGRNAGPTGAGRGRKAVFRDRDRELQDPDYRRGVQRFDRFDPNYAPVPQPGLYNTPNYSSEFPSLPGGKAPSGQHPNPKGGYRQEYGSWQPGPGYRHPPPPPPPNPPMAGKPYMPTGPPQVAMARTPYGGMPPMGAFPMHGMGMFAPGMGPGVPGPGPQPMYGPPPPYAYPGMPMAPAGYGYLPPPPPGQELAMSPAGPFPMYAGYPPGPGPMGPYPPGMPQAPTPPTRAMQQNMPYSEYSQHAGPERSHYDGRVSGPGTSHQSAYDSSRKPEGASGDDVSGGPN